MFNSIATALAIGTYAVWEQDITFVETPRYKLIDMFLPFIYA